MASGRGFSGNMKANLNKVSGGLHPLVCLEISNEFLAEPIYLVRDKQDFVGELDGVNQTFIACPFEIELPNDFDRREPNTQLSIANINRELVSWIEQTEGARESLIRMLIYMKNDPKLVELDCCFNVKQISINSSEIQFTLGYTRTLNLRVAGLIYSRFYFPGLY